MLSTSSSLVRSRIHSSTETASSRKNDGFEPLGNPGVMHLLTVASSIWLPSTCPRTANGDCRLRKFRADLRCYRNRKAGSGRMTLPTLLSTTHSDLACLGHFHGKKHSPACLGSPSTLFGSRVYVSERSPPTRMIAMGGMALAMILSMTFHGVLHRLGTNATASVPVLCPVGVLGQCQWLA